MISHKNLLANFEQQVSDYFVQYGRAVAPDVTIVSWLPFYHDMGLLVGIGFPVLSGFAPWSRVRCRSCSGRRGGCK